MKCVSKYLMLLFVLVSLKAVSASTLSSPFWIYSDTAIGYGTFAIYDTARNISFNRLFETDTGNSYNGTNYINFDYQFSSDSLYILDKYPNANGGYDTLYRDYRPGYAGFKIDWDGGITGFSLAGYKYIAFAHNGPLSNHKVTIRFGYNTGCGTATHFQVLGSFPASSTWKIDTITLPDSVINISATDAANRSYYEMEVLITNASPSDTNKSSAPGCLKIDNVCLIKAAPAPAAKKSGCGAGAGLAFIPPILFKIASDRKRKKKNSQKA